MQNSAAAQRQFGETPCAAGEKVRPTGSSTGGMSIVWLLSRCLGDRSPQVRSFIIVTVTSGTTTPLTWRFYLQGQNIAVTTHKSGGMPRTERGDAFMSRELRFIGPPGT
jgi:hypothetical protein